jgi:hypothetical protein
MSSGKAIQCFDLLGDFEKPWDLPLVIYFGRLAFTTKIKKWSQRIQHITDEQAKISTLDAAQCVCQKDFRPR